MITKDFKQSFALFTSLVLFIGLLTACQSPPKEPSAYGQPPEIQRPEQNGLTVDPHVEPPLSDVALTISVPDFFDEEQKSLYRRAYSLYQHVFGGDTSSVEYAEFDEAERISREYESVMLDGVEYTIAQGRYRHWADFTAVIHAVFTENFWDSRNTAYSKGGFYREQNGNLCFIDAARGAGYYYNENFPDQFILLEKTDSTILFLLIGHYSPVWPREGETSEDRNKRRAREYEYTMEFPMKLVLSENGWRFDEFYSALADEKDENGI
jgi:hypothetical protein